MARQIFKKFTSLLREKLLDEFVLELFVKRVHSENCFPDLAAKGLPPMLRLETMSITGKNYNLSETAAERLTCVISIL